MLVVKLSSLGDVVHTLPAVMDIQKNFPHAQIDWVVEPGFASVVAACSAVHRVIACDMRHWRHNLWTPQTRLAWQAFKVALQQERYDAILDLQGLSKSALVSWLARTQPTGQRYAMAHATHGSAYERPTRWVADVAIQIKPHVHAMERARLVCAQALGYALSAPVQYGLTFESPTLATNDKQIVLVHGTSRADKEWPLLHWHALGMRLSEAGYHIMLPHGNEEERLRSEALAEMIPHTTVWPRMALDELMQAMAPCAGVIGVDSGLSHIAVALDLPHVQIYNFDTAWRTGPIGNPRQRSVVDFPTPTVDAIWSAWLECIT